MQSNVGNKQTLRLPYELEYRHDENVSARLPAIHIDEKGQRLRRISYMPPGFRRPTMIVSYATFGLNFKLADVLYCLAAVTVAKLSICQVQRAEQYGVDGQVGELQESWN